MTSSGIVAVGDRLVFTEFDGSCPIVLYDPAADAVIWSCDTGRSDVRSLRPVLVGNTIVVRLENTIVAADFQTGALQWTLEVFEVDGVFGQLPGLAADENYVYYSERPVTALTFLWSMLSASIAAPGSGHGQTEQSSALRL